MMTREDVVSVATLCMYFEEKILPIIDDGLLTHVRFRSDDDQVSITVSDSQPTPTVKLRRMTLHFRAKKISTLGSTYREAFDAMKKKVGEAAPAGEKAAAE